MNRCVSNGLMVWIVKETKKKKENKSEMSDVEFFLFIYLFSWNQKCPFFETKTK